MGQTEPDARYHHGAFSSGQNMVVWAGDGSRSDVLETFNVFSHAWREAKTLRASDAPERLDSMAVASDGDSKLYSFGGDGGRGLINSIFCLDTNSLECREIVPATGTDTPSPRHSSAMVHFNRQLIVHGGWTNDGASSDLLRFHLDNSKDCKGVCHLFVSCRRERRPSA